MWLCFLVRDDATMQASLAADIERFKPRLLTGRALDAARRREQPVLFAAQVCLKYQVCRARLPGGMCA